MSWLHKSPRCLASDEAREVPDARADRADLGDAACKDAELLPRELKLTFLRSLHSTRASYGHPRRFLGAS